MANGTGKRNRPELLAPAGNFEGFLGCVKAGADAVYLGGDRFGARAYADNFSDEELIRAIRYAHVFGVKVYLTINTLIKEKEFADAIAFVKPLAEAGLDACIVQDLGLAAALLKEYPKVQFHASTQCFVTGPASAQYLKDLGASRVVLAREMTLPEIKKIKANVDVELETFIHGAMCYCYSGQCLFSASLGGRSGNRGRCAGPCRLAYGSEEEYLLSMKDQFTLPILPKILEAGVDSLKIEGRMKKAEYAAFVTSVYRKYIDLYLRGEKFSIDPKDITDLSAIYLRSQTGTGYYERSKGPEMITFDDPAYKGSSDQLLGTIRKEYLDEPLRREVNGTFYAHAGENILLSLTSGDKSVTVTGQAAQKANNRATTKEEICKNLRKFGNSPFKAGDMILDVEEDLFLPMGLINELRRQATEELIDAF